MSKKYNIIYADPPWDFKNKKTGGSLKSSASQKYTTTSIETLKRIDVQSVCHDDCMLFMWWVGSMPQEAIDLVSAWGFELKNMNGFVWNKLTANRKPHFGMGFYTRAGSESMLIARKGRFKPFAKNVRAVLSRDQQIQAEGVAPPIHSRKPAQFRDLIVELCGDLPRLEMFSREAVDGWDRCGFEAPSGDKIEIPEKRKK